MDSKESATEQRRVSGGRVKTGYGNAGYVITGGSVLVFSQQFLVAATGNKELILGAV